jgi:hypothetical protein
VICSFTVTFQNKNLLIEFVDDGITRNSTNSTSSGKYSSAAEDEFGNRINDKNRFVSFSLESFYAESE